MNRFENINISSTGKSVNEDTFLLLLCESLYSVTVDPENNVEIVQSA